MEIAQVASPQYMTRNGWTPDMIVLHISEGYYESGIGWLCRVGGTSSAHFMIAKDGRVTQMVDLRKAAWVNGTSDDSDDNRYYGKSTSKIIRDRKTNANYYSVGIEFEGFYSKDIQLTAAQIKTIVWLIGYIKEQVKEIYSKDILIDRRHILGHYEVNPITKPNCGRNFQYDEILSRLTPTENIIEGEDEMAVIIYNTISDVPEYGKKTIQKLIDNKLISGDGEGLNLTEDMIRIFVVNDRAGSYD